MEAKQFDILLKLIQDKRNKSKFYERELLNYFTNVLKDDFQEYSQQLNLYLDNYIEYLEILGRYENSEKLTPLDVFPGIQTIKDITNIEEMESDNIKMEKLASSIKELESSIDSREHDLVTTVKKINNDLQNTLLLNEEVRNNLQEILYEVDSIYDAGFLSKNT